MRRIIRQSVRFIDINNEIIQPDIKVDIIIDKQRGCFKLIANEYVTISSLIDLICGNKQIRKLTGDRKVYSAEAKYFREYFIKTNIHFDGIVEMYDKEIICHINSDENMIKETGWMTFKDVEKILKSFDASVPSLKESKKLLYTIYDFEYYREKEL